MARVNIGVDPMFISDQHLIAESVEITMITGGLRANNYLIKSPVPNEFSLGKGHINFFKDKLLYLKLRLDQVNLELDRRYIKNSTTINVMEFPMELQNHWRPTLEESFELRYRMYERLLNPLKAKVGFHKYYKESIGDVQSFAEKIINSPLYYV